MSATPDGTSTGTMTCPKCGAEMRTHERNGVTIEQCRKCHGIFLDAGEFEQLLGREMSPLGHDSADGTERGWRPWRR
jgi:Zn-finger nucleic acid-binding protein